MRIIIPKLNIPPQRFLKQAGYAMITNPHKNQEISSSYQLNGNTINFNVANFDQTKNSLCLVDTLNNRILLTTNFLGVINAQTGSC